MATRVSNYRGFVANRDWGGVAVVAPSNKPQRQQPLMTEQLDKLLGPGQYIIDEESGWAVVDADLLKTEKATKILSKRFAAAVVGRAGLIDLYPCDRVQ